MKIQHQNFILENWEDVVKLNKDSECFKKRCEYYNHTLAEEKKTCKEYDNWKNIVENANFKFVLDDICVPVYYIYLVLNWLNFICILGIFSLQSLLIVYKFYFLFLHPQFNDSEHDCIMKDDKVVVHSL